MAKKLNLPAKKEDREKSVSGWFPTQKDLLRFTKDMNLEEIEIFNDAYNSMTLSHHNSLQYMPMLKTYALNMAKYFKVLSNIGEDFVLVNTKGDEQINPLILVADRFYNNAFKISKQLGLDPKSQAQLEPAAPPEKPIRSGSDEFKK
jgi:phage terminase small subunit